MSRSLRGWVCALSIVAGCFSPEDPEAFETEAVGSSGDAEAPSCSEYCALVGDHCGDEVEQYSGTSVCEATCALMAPGTNEDVLGNTVGCRVHHSILAGEQADPHCFHAGPSGDNTCGSRCESFCTLALAACTGDLAPFADAEACISACSSLEAGPDFSSSLPDDDSVSCRIKHVSLAALQPDVHCAHIGVDSPVCQ